MLLPPEPPHPHPHRMALLRVSMALVCASKRCENVHMFVTFPSFLFFSNVMIQDCTKLGSFFLFLWHVAQIHCKYQCKKALLRSPAPASKNGCGSQMTCNLQYEMTPSCAPRRPSQQSCWICHCYPTLHCATNLSPRGRDHDEHSQAEIAAIAGGVRASDVSRFPEL